MWFYYCGISMFIQIYYYFYNTIHRQHLQWQHQETDQPHHMGVWGQTRRGPITLRGDDSLVGQ